MQLEKTIEQHYVDTRAKGESLSMGHKVCRVESLRTVMISGLKLSVYDKPLRRDLEQGGKRLLDSSGMAQLVPIVLADEQHTLAREVTGRHLSAIFDGTTDGAEVLALLVRQVGRA
jgi:hypothetical protein